MIRFFQAAARLPKLQETNVPTRCTNQKLIAQKVDAWQPDNASQPEELAELLSLSETISKGFSQCSSFINALLSANVNDNQAKLLSGDLYAKLPMLQAAETVFSKKKLTEFLMKTGRHY